jgi:thiamine biosynthesis protein ThiS
MKIRLNGTEREVRAATVAEMIAELQLPTERIAVERNRQIVKKADWPRAGLAEGDQIEVVHFVGGG